MNRFRLLKLLICLVTVSIFLPKIVDADWNSENSGLSGLVRSGNLVLKVNRLCLGASVAHAVEVPKTLSLFVFVATLNLDTEQFLFKRKTLPEFQSFKIDDFNVIDETSVPGKELFFEDLELSVPVSEIDSALSGMRFPYPPSFTNLINGILGEDMTSKARILKTLGLVIEVAGVQSFVSFNGEHSKIVDNLLETDGMTAEGEGLLFLDYLWPRTATLVNHSRAFVSYNNRHEGYRSKLSCEHKAFVEFELSTDSKAY